MSTDLARSWEQWCLYRVSVFHQTLIVSTQTDEEENARHVLETVDPLPPFALLATHVNHQHLVISQVETCLRDADRPSPTLDNVLFVRSIVGIKEPLQIGEVIV